MKNPVPRNLFFWVIYTKNNAIRIENPTDGINKNRSPMKVPIGNTRLLTKLKGKRYAKMENENIGLAFLNLNIPYKSKEYVAREISGNKFHMD